MWNFYFNKKVRVQFKSDILIVQSLSIVISLFFLSVQSLVEIPNNYFDGFFITDSTTIFDAIGEMVNSKNYIEALEERGSGIRFIYLPIYLINGKLIFLQNIVFNLISIKNIYNIFSTRRSSICSSVCVGFFPYTLLTIGGPNKEIVLILFTVLFFSREIRRRNFLFHIFILSILCFVRDGYGALFVIIFCLKYFFNQKLGNLLLFKVIPFTIIIVYSFLGKIVVLISYFQQFTENSQWIASEMSQNAESSITEFSTSKALEYEDNPIIQVLLFVYRIYANIFSQLIRPFLFTVDGKAYLIGFSYFFLGLLVAVSFILFFQLVIKKSLSFRFSNKEVLIMNSIPLLLIGSSYSIFIQQRYLYPFIPIVVGIIAIFGFRVIIKRFLILFLMSICLYLILTFFVGLPSLKIESSKIFFKPQYIYQ